MRELNDNSDHAFPNGLFIEPRNPQKPRTKLRPLLQYCKENGKSPLELSEEEINIFTIYP